MPKIRSVSDIKSKLLRPALTSFYEVDIDLPKGDGKLAGLLSASVSYTHLTLPTILLV